MTHPAPLPKEGLRTIAERHEQADAPRDIGGVQHRTWASSNGWQAHTDRAALLSHIAASGWQPISSAPRDGTEFLAYLQGDHPYYGKAGYRVIKWERDGWRLPPSGWEPTHWQPLLPGPETEME